MNTHFAPSRRTVLKSGGALVVSFSVAGPVMSSKPSSNTANSPHGPAPMMRTSVLMGSLILSPSSRGLFHGARQRV